MTSWVKMRTPHTWMQWVLLTLPPQSQETADVSRCVIVIIPYSGYNNYYFEDINFRGRKDFADLFFVDFISLLAHACDINIRGYTVEPPTRGQPLYKGQ